MPVKMTIMPQVGDRMIFYPSGWKSRDEAKLAFVTKVWSHEVVNLTVFDHDGTHDRKPHTSVRILDMQSAAAGEEHVQWPEVDLSMLGAASQPQQAPRSAMGSSPVVNPVSDLHKQSTPTSRDSSSVLNPSFVEAVERVQRFTAK